MKKNTAIKTIDDYLSVTAEPARSTLEKVRKVIRQTAPMAEECISYQVPCYKYLGMLVGFAAFKNHCSFFVMGTTFMKTLKDDLKQYQTATATIRFAIDKPLPVALIKKIVRGRMKENELRQLVRSKKEIK